MNGLLIKVTELKIKKNSFYNFCLFACVCAHQSKQWLNRFLSGFLSRHIPIQLKKSRRKPKYMGAEPQTKANMYIINQSRSELRL